MNDYIIVGGGIVGLTLGRKILQTNPDSSLLIMEANHEVGREASSHNSGVVHAGLYYEAGTLKASLCSAGARKLTEFCEAKGVAIQFPGKLVVATNQIESNRLEELYKRATIAGATVQLLNSGQISEVEPRVRGAAAILSPKSGIVDYGDVCLALRGEIEERGGTVVTSARVTQVSKWSSTTSTVTTDSGDEFEAKTIIFAASHWSLRLAQSIGLASGLRSLFFKGVYRELRSRLSEKMIYPVPNPKFPFLGVHITNHIDGSATVGPNSQLSLQKSHRKDSEPIDAYTFVNSGSFAIRNLTHTALESLSGNLKSMYLSQLRKYIPDLDRDVLTSKTEYGIRHQVVKAKSGLLHDYHVVSSDGLVFIVNTPSPAATSAFAIADYVYDKYLDTTI